MSKIFEAWCDKCKWFTTHIEVNKNSQTIVKCLGCLKWTIITYILDDSLEGGSAGNSKREKRPATLKKEAL